MNELPLGVMTRFLAVALGLYVAALFAMSIYASRRIRNEEDYLVAGRRLPLYLAWGTLMATWFGAESLMGASQAARDDGVRATVLDPFACAAMLVLFGLFFAKPLWRMRILTTADFYRRVYGPRAEVLSSAIQVPAYFGWIAAQYVALGGVLHAYFGIPLVWGILLAMSVTLCYTMIGGMWSVTLTDTAQIVLALVGLVFLADAVFDHVGGGSVFAGVNRMLSETDPDHLTLLPAAGAAAMLGWLGTWATGLFGNVPGQDLQQRVFAARDEKTAARACILTGVLYLAFGMMSVGLGVVSKITHPENVSGDILPVLAGQFLSPLMVVVFVVSLVSIIISTATSAVLAPAAILGHNLLGRLKWFPVRGVLLDRLCVLLIALGGLTLAYTGKSILELLDDSLSVALAGLFVPMLMGLYGRPRSQLSALLAMGLGTAWWLVRYLAENVLLPLPDEAEAAGLAFGDYLSLRLASEGAGGLLVRAAAAWGHIPADLGGLAASFAGYFLGQRYGRPLSPKI